MAYEELSITSRFSNNALIIVDALRKSDLQTAIHLRDVVQDATSESHPGYCQYRRVTSGSEFHSFLDEINEGVKNGMRPILHIEAHGDKDLGIQISASGETIPWQTLLPKLQTINKNSKNNLGVVMAACYGLHAIRRLNFMEPSPFYFLVGSEEGVSAGYIDDSMKDFYLELNRTNSLDNAMRKVDKNFKQFHAEKFFYVMFGKYMKRHCMGAGGQRRVERLLTGLRERGVVTNGDTMRAFRRCAKSFVRNPKQAFHKYASVFLHGRISVRYAELEKFIRSID